MKEYYLDKQTFVIENYDRNKPFASFLPGVAGSKGIPMWVYYTNRGQGIAGFGIENKDGSILDFVPANQAYRRTETAGFRTFIKVDGKVFEVFDSSTTEGVKRAMGIEANRLSFTEENQEFGLKVEVAYITITNETYPGLMRQVTITSLTDTAKNIEVLDGLNTLWPYGNDNASIKDMSNLAVAWFETYNSENNMPFFRNRSTTADSAEVGTVEAGHFAASFLKGSDTPLPIIYDPEVVFGNNTAGSLAEGLMENPLNKLLEIEQISANKIPCAFTAFSGSTAEPFVLYSVFGKMDHVDLLNEKANEMTPAYFEKQMAMAVALGESLTEDVVGMTNYPTFDAYVRQSYLDNLLRGGYPMVFEGKEGPIVYHIYSRIHGDMEREYNNFYVEPAYYSQGIGAFRDVNQNRRNDVYFVPEAGRFNIKQFMELIQLDGQNPLSIRGSKITVDPAATDSLLEYVVTGAKVVKGIIEKAFTPGELMTAIDRERVELSISKDDFLIKVMAEGTQEIQAAYGHGFWVDHWTYNMDLVDYYLNIFPEMKEELLFTDSYRYFVSEATVLPRADKYVINKAGQVRQYDAIMIDKERMARMGLVAQGTNWLTQADGSLYRSNLFVKLFTLVLNKAASMDPSGVGIMMNTDKPGWNDAMNGLPGLFGSGTSENIELKRIVCFLLEGSNQQEQVLPVEVKAFMDAYGIALSQYLRDEISCVQLFEAACEAKEAYNLAIHYGISGQMTSESGTRIYGLLEQILEKLEEGLDIATKMGQGIMPSYFVHEAKAYELIEGHVHPVNGLQTVKVLEWEIRPLPLYLEAPARYLKQLKDPEAAKAIYDRIYESDMYDKALGMYMTSESLEEESLEIGRARAFTAGWLERESIFMHMEYKYLLGLLKSGVYDGFFSAIKTALPPFMDPKVYGRSTLENSSFIASSRNPNPANHGRGFVSRLTGTTSELISMWLKMMTGLKVFELENDTLVFNLHPVLPGDFFKDEKVTFTLFGHIQVTYMNPTMANTYGEGAVKPAKYLITYKDGHTVEAAKVTGTYASDIREGKVCEILVTLQ